MTEADRTVYAQELLSWSHLLDTVAMSFEDYQSDREGEDARILTVRELRVGPNIQPSTALLGAKPAL